MTAPRLRPSPLIPIAGGVSLLYGLVLAAISDRVPGVAWYAVSITLLGFVLIVIWWRGRR